MKRMRTILTIWLTSSILVAGFLARSAQFHEWLHEGEEHCQVEESHCHHKGQTGHHHEGEGTEEHPHGLLTLMAGSAMDGPVAAFICPEPIHAHWSYMSWRMSELPSLRTWRATLGRAPPIHA